MQIPTASEISIGSRVNLDKYTRAIVWKSISTTTVMYHIEEGNFFNMPLKKKFIYIYIIT